MRRRRKQKPSGLLPTLGRAGDGRNCDGDMTGCIKEITKKSDLYHNIISRSLDTEAPPSCPGESCPGCPGSHCAKDLSMNRFVSVSLSLRLCMCVFVYEILLLLFSLSLIYLCICSSREMFTVSSPPEEDSDSALLIPSRETETPRTKRRFQIIAIIIPIIKTINHHYHHHH